MRNIWLLFCICFSLTAYSQDSCSMQLGTNLDFFGPGIFKDLKMASTQFQTRNRFKDSTDNDWNSYLIDSIVVDEAGYPLSLPFIHESVDNQQVVSFSVGYNRNHRIGDYVMLYDGDGVFRFSDWSAVSNIVETPGRITFSIDSLVDIGFNIIIDSSTSGNHIRNIRILESIHEDNYVEKPVREEFIEIAKDFSTLRLMNWIYANDNDIIDWEDRIKPIRHTQVNDKKGIAFEHIITFANALDCDLWLNIPFRASDAYIDSMAAMFSQNLDEGIHIFLEYGNELWNTDFAGGQWFHANSTESTIGRTYGKRAISVFDIWGKHFSSENDKINTVMAGHDYFVIDALEEIMSNRNSLDGIDFVSYPGHIVLDDIDYHELEILGENATAEDVIDLFYQQFSNSIYWQSAFKELVVNRFQKPFIMYEGSPSFTNAFPGENRPYSQAIYEANSHPKIYSLLDSMINYFEQELDVKLFNQYTLSGSYDNPYGAYGALDNLYISEPWPPKYQVLRDRLDYCLGNSSNQDIDNVKELIILPNPADAFIDIQNVEKIEEIAIFNQQGKKVLSLQNPPNRINIQSLSSGIYFVKVMDNHSKYFTGKILVQK